MHLRIVGLVVAAALLFPKIADACGVWHMTDVEKKWQVDWLINAGSIMNDKTKAKLNAIYLDTENKAGMRVVKDRKVVFDLAGDKLRRYGKSVATFDDKSVTFGKRIYTFEMTDAGDWHGMPSWKVTVKRGDVTVIESAQASALCAAARAQSLSGIDLPHADHMKEIRTRMMFYLAWRETGF
jgi:hypothetical protein